MSPGPFTGLFGLLDPVLAFADGLIGFLPPLARLLLWGALAGAISILLYRKVSPQPRLGALAEETAAIRVSLKSMRAHEAGYFGLAARSMKLGLKRLGLSLLPALLSSLPVLAMVAFLDARYGLTLPEPGEPVAILAPSGEDIALDRGQRFSAGWVFPWPGQGDAVTVRDRTGSEILSITPQTLPGRAASSGILSLLFGSPAGSLPQHSAVGSLAIETTPRDLLQDNLIFPLQWTIPYFLALILASVGLKMALRIK